MTAPVPDYAIQVREAARGGLKEVFSLLLQHVPDTMSEAVRHLGLFAEPTLAPPPLIPRNTASCAALQEGADSDDDAKSDAKSDATDSESSVDASDDDSNSSGDEERQAGATEVVKGGP